MNKLRSIPARKERLDIRSRLLDFFVYFLAVPFRHDDIEDEKLDPVPMRSEFLYRLFAVICRYHGIAEFLEHGPRKLSDIFIVLGQENCLGTPLGRGRFAD